MSGTGEIIGDLAESALAARAVEPAHGETPDGHSEETSCLNCGTALIGSHCHACGQAAHVHKTLGAFFHDLLHGVFHFEGKIWRTLPMLAWRPGQLTREYIDGRRASYISPIALFLFSVFLMFAVIKQVGGSLDTLATDQGNGSVKTETARKITENEKQMTQLRGERATLVKSGKPTAEIDQLIKDHEIAQTALKTMSETLDGRPTDQLKALNIHSDLAPVQRAVDEFRANPGLVLFKVQSNAYKFSWALIPISVPFVWLLFPFSRRFRLYDHTVFVTYSLCFMTLLTTAMVLGDWLGLPFLAAVGMLVPPVHMYRQLRGTYGLSRASALWRTAALLFVALFALILFAVLILAETGA